VTHDERRLRIAIGLLVETLDGGHLPAFLGY